VTVAGVVDHDIQPSEMLGGALDAVKRRRPVGDIELQRQHQFAVLADERFKRLHIAGSRRDAIASVQGGVCPFPSEALRCAGDEPCLAHDGFPFI
jgi:hypothetical protein